MDELDGLRPEQIVRYYETNGRLPDDFNPYGDYSINPSEDLLFIGELKPQTEVEGYNGSDSYFGINDLDPDRKSIFISLPKPPELKLIDGYGLNQDEQYFRRKETPAKLKKLELDTLKELQSAKKTNRQEAITGYKVLDFFWQVFDDEASDYKDEIQFIKHTWWHRIYGYWFFNDGKPTYITGRHFSFLNFFYMADLLETQGYPEYRDRHRREFLFREYLRYAHHTFAKRDERGWAVPEEDGSYQMTDMRMPIFLGDIHPKSRRNGSTMMGLNEMIEGAELGTKKYSTLISKDGDSTVKHYQFSLLPAWAAKPVYLKPMWKGGIAPSQIRYSPPNNAYGIETLGSVIEPTTSAGMFKSDGNKFNGFILFDEEGKQEAGGADIAQRWNVYRQAMTLGDSSRIIGYCSHISTVEEINSSGRAFLEILENSDFYQRGTNGRTLSGLAAMFFPAYDGLEGFIDRFGLSVINAPTDRQIELRNNAEFAIFGKGAYQYQTENRADYIAKGTPSAMRDYRAYLKKFPHRSSELTIGTSGDIGWDYEALDKRIAELRKLHSLGKPPVKRGSFHRENNDPDGRVYWRTEEDGRFELSMELPTEQTNLKKRTLMWDVEKGTMVPSWEPMYKSRFSMGVDPFEYSNSKTDTGTSKQSDGSITVVRCRDASVDTSDDPHDWHTWRIVLTYRYRPASLLDFNEDCLMAAEYFGAMVFLERNKTGTWEHFVRRGRSGFLRYQQDLVTGKLADKPGYYAQGASKDEMFSTLKDYINYRIYEDDHLGFQEEARNIRAKDELTKCDQLASAGAAFLGEKSPHGKAQERMLSQSIDLSKSWLRM